MPTITEILAGLSVQLDAYRNETEAELEAESYEHEQTRAQLDRIQRELIKQLLIVANVKQLLINAEMRQISEQDAMGQMRGFLYHE